MFEITGVLWIVEGSIFVTPGPFQNWQVNSWYPTEKNTRGYKSEDLGGQVMKPPCPIRLFEKARSNWSRIHLP
ncbi:hypothetical protein TNCV_2667961 [Trichonephila clavipes]|nr:hypothetical protein TNCV_2667961 [Trichonephila clavipes]